MNSLKKKARIAGILYLLLGITGMFGLMYVPSKIMVPGDATATAHNIMNAEWLFRSGIVSNLVCQTLFIFLVLALYHLFKGVNKKHALLMVALVVVAVPIAFLNTLNQIAALLLLNGADYLAVFTADQLHAQVMFFLDLYNHGIYVVEIFWGLWLFPFGLLVYKSEFLPRILGILLMIACVGYLAQSFTLLLFPQYGDIVSTFTSVTGTAGEFSILLWLLIKGVKVPQRASMETAAGQ